MLTTNKLYPTLLLTISLLLLGCDANNTSTTEFSPTENETQEEQPKNPSIDDTPATQQATYQQLQIESCNANAGEPNVVSVCPGEDWWLPDGVHNSKSGVVYANGWTVPEGYPDAVDPDDISGETQTTTTGQTITANWASFEKQADLDVKAGIPYSLSLSKKSIDATSLSTALGKFLNGAQLDPENKKSIFIPLQTSIDGTDAPEHIGLAGAVSLSNKINSWYSGLSEEQKTDLEETVHGSSTGKGWLDVVDAHPNDYNLLNLTYHRRQKTFFKALYEYLIVDNPDTFGQLTYTFNLSGENCLMSSYYQSGLYTLDNISTIANSRFENALDSGFPMSSWLACICTGGPGYSQYAKLAQEHASGIGTHGAWLLHFHSTLMLLDHLKYNETWKTYQVVKEMPYAFFATDVTNFGQTDLDGDDTTVSFEDSNTFGEYLFFKQAVRYAISIGVNRFVLQQYAMPSLGKYTDWAIKTMRSWMINDYARRFDWSSIETLNAENFLKWMNKMAGRKANGPEAYCTLIQHGKKMENLDDTCDHTPTPFECRENKIKAQDDLGFGEDDKDWQAFMKTPLVTHYGHYCNLDETIPQGQGTPSLQLTSERTLGKTTPEATDSNFGARSASDTEIYIYEGRTTDNPEDFDDFAKEANHSLYFHLNDDFIAHAKSLNDTGIGDYAVKVTFENFQGGSGEFRLEYDSIEGWKEGPVVAFDPTQPTQQTATFRLQDARFENNGTQGTDLALRTVSGTNVAFLNIRVIKANFSDEL